MSPPTTSTRVAGRRSARPARPDSSWRACSGLPGIASTVSLNHPRSPAMLADRSAISIANSETGQPRLSGVLVGRLALVGAVGGVLLGVDPPDGHAGSLVV